MKLSEILDFFRNNDCEVEIFFLPDRFFIWSKISKRYLLQDATEQQVINFYKLWKDTQELAV